MEPDYVDGGTVEFQIIRVDVDGVKVGSDYVICRNDCTATFKHVVENDGEILTLAPLNQKKYPGSFTVSWQEVSRIARVAHRLTGPPPERTLKVRKK